MYAKPQHRAAQRIGWREHNRSGQERPIGIRQQKDRREPIIPLPWLLASAAPPSLGGAEALTPTLSHAERATSPSIGARYATCSSTVAIPWPTPMHIVARP